MFNDPDGDCAKCPKNAKQGDTFTTGFEAGAATPNNQMISGTNGSLFFGSEKASNMLWGNYGEDGGNTNWRVLSFEFESGARYTWDDAKQWYADADGNEFDDSWAFDGTNMVGGAVGPTAHMAINGVRDGDPFKDIKSAIEAHGGSLSSFAWSSAKRLVSDLSAGGHRGTQAWGGLYTGFLMSGGPVGGSVSFGTRALTVTTTDGYLFGSIAFRMPFSMGVQRFGAMGVSGLDFWSPSLYGSSRFGVRTISAILPEWNDLSVYTTGTLTRGTPVRFGIAGPQALRNPGGFFQLQISSRSVTGQASIFVR